MINMAKKDYTKKKIAITLDELLLKKIEKVKEYPRWRGNRSEVIEEGVREFLEKDINKESKCIFCGCTDGKMNEGYWVIADRKKGIGVCSQCALKVMGDPEKLKKIIRWSKQK